jgi:quercetin dioxygenase-like cupin family protein
MQIKKKTEQTSSKGPSQTFTGDVSVVSLIDMPEPGRVRSAVVTFQPGARSFWHKHPLGQTLIVTEGTGWVKSEGQPKQVINEGDTVCCPPNEKHWHGATPTTKMTHIAIQEALDGKMIEWMEEVTEEEYNS